ncbi:hypothetical protein GPECTOR_9g426 [Gonium pectorale]|uniref:Uncharacterized protein n=1 Tax=Gonium pectorale TaxID=33097 RepID=A0A150GRK0_GONPE|nr:hypothetical protein GPECTOR_9g426 [Gonium pectorale]|eukprot:KXZ52382.1 hypothetical protein GPECTOR_9g426 [Gonium pectorale]
MLLTCSAWYRSLKSVVPSLRPHHLGDPALGLPYTSLSTLEAPLARKVDPLLPIPQLAPLRHPDRLASLFPSLVRLNIAGQQLGAQGLQSLLPLAGTLQHLDASGCAIRAADLPHLACLTHLTSLALNGVQLVPPQSPGRPGWRCAQSIAAEFAHRLPRLARLRRLELGLEEWSWMQYLQERTGEGHLAGAAAAAAGGPA